MKKLLLLTTAIILSLGAVACNKKKDGSKVSRGNRGYHAGTSPGQSELGIQNGSGWDALDNSPKSDVYNYNMSQVAPEFLMSGGVPQNEIGEISGDYPTNVVVAMNLVRGANGSIDTQNSRLGIVFWDSYTQSGAAPLTVYFGPEAQSNVRGQVNYSWANVTFSDSSGSVTVDGQVQNGQFVGSIQYVSNNGSRGTLGTFRLSVNGTIF